MRLSPPTAFSLQNPGFAHFVCRQRSQTRHSSRHQGRSMFRIVIFRLFQQLKRQLVILGCQPAWYNCGLVF